METPKAQLFVFAPEMTSHPSPSPYYHFTPSLIIQKPVRDFIHLSHTTPRPHHLSKLLPQHTYVINQGDLPRCQNNIILYSLLNARRVECVFSIRGTHSYHTHTYQLRALKLSRLQHLFVRYEFSNGDDAFHRDDGVEIGSPL